jgi:bifunctional non-homologous end joining protein LigD
MQTQTSRLVRVTHPERVLFPADGITKGELVDYYRDVAHWILPYLRDRPLTLQRWPEGIRAPCFFEKTLPRWAPPWLATTRQPRRADRTKSAFVEYPLCDDEASLLWFANIGAITFHVWMSRVQAPGSPDYLWFDLDPLEGCPVKSLARVALRVREVLAATRLEPRVKTTGGKGLHVIAPLPGATTYDAARGFEQQVALRMKEEMPDLVELEFSKTKRARGKVYFDWSQLGHGKTMVPPFTVRGRDGAPVSMPLPWSEVERLAESRSTKPTTEIFRAWNLKTVPALLAERGDPWKGSWR